MALGRPRNSTWLRDFGCKISDHMKRFKFLGVWSGRELTQMEKPRKSVTPSNAGWVNEVLTFSSRLLLIKHVLTAIPAHHLMSIGLDRKCLTRINRTPDGFQRSRIEELFSKLGIWSDRVNLAHVLYKMRTAGDWRTSLSSKTSKKYPEEISNPSWQYTTRSTATHFRGNLEKALEFRHLLTNKAQNLALFAQRLLLQLTGARYEQR
ncbi:hypothetical protein R1sor_005864 [Riccia sorocarpa]|uniref:Uncharacterized protein n=1 Tax=Riccia sorocarpa TaxID=122646 RepID=A0ABD3HLA8_9MARC